LGDKKKGWQLVAHHIATVILIAYSYYLNVTRVGVMVLVCHEANGIFLEAAKMARYAKVSEAISTALFVTYMLSWFATGIYAFGFMVIRSALFESQEHFAEINVSIEPHWAILNGFLLFLSVLHIYWSCLIIQVAMRQLAHGYYRSTSRPAHAKHANPRAYFINNNQILILVVRVCCGAAKAVAEIEL
jgi:ceramide synthetase